MTEDVRRPAGFAEAPSAADRLDSWKEIGAYLKRDATTVRRWEKREGLPVHRHLHDRRESVYAYRHEIDRWWDERRNGLADKPLEAGILAGGRERLAWMAAALLAMSALALAAVLLTRGFGGDPAIAPRVVRLTTQPAQPAVDFALSPDGRLLAFVSGGENDARIWIRPLDALTPQVVAGTEGAESLFWSPDSRFIAFGAGGKLKKVAASGGAVHTLCDARVVIGGSWSRDNVIVFTPDNRRPIYRVSAMGGDPVAVTTLDASQGHNTHRWPHFLPDGRRFLYLARGTRPESSGIYAGSLASISPTLVVRAESRVSYADPGYLLFARDRALLAQPFDANTLRARGEALQVLEDVLYNRADSHAGFSVSDHGEMAYQTAVPRSSLVWLNRAGERQPQSNAFEDSEEPSLSPDGRRVAVSRSTGPSTDIWLLDLTTGHSRVTSDPSADRMPIWSPDGASVVFASNRDGPSDLYRMSSSGTGPAEPIVKTGTVKHPSDWSPAAGVIVYENNDPKTGWDLWTVPARAGGAPTPFLRTEFAEGHGRLSPDGRWMAYVSNESGTNDVFIRPFPASNGKSKISTAGGGQPRWRGDGRELFYLAADGQLMSVAFSRDRASVPKPLFDTRASQNGEWSYDVTRDGQLFVVSVPMGEPAPAPIVVVLNWAAAVQPPASAESTRRTTAAPSR